MNRDYYKYRGRKERKMKRELKGDEGKRVEKE